MEMDSWVNEMGILLNQFSTIDLGYPKGNNSINSRASKDVINKLLERVGGVDNSVISFYEHSNGINLPDVHVGYFIAPVENILRGIDRGDPIKLIGQLSGNILAFGSDGGGGRFAIRVGVGDVLYLPVGRIKNGEFDGLKYPVKKIADNFSEFLLRLKNDVNSFINDIPNWKYIV